MLDSDRMKARCRPYLSIAALLLLAASAAGCGEPGSDPVVDRKEIEDVLRQYLPKLGQAYAGRDASILKGFAVPKEMARIDLRTEELTASGRVYEPEFKEVTVEDVSVWNYANAFVTTLEVWDVRSYTLGTHLLVNESVGQRNRVKYQMKRKEGSWVILYRELDQTFEP
jgi:ARC6-like, IMS domain